MDGRLDSCLPGGIPIQSLRGLPEAHCQGVCRRLLSMIVYPYAHLPAYLPPSLSNSAVACTYTAPEPLRRQS